MQRDLGSLGVVAVLVSVSVPVPTAIFLFIICLRRAPHATVHEAVQAPSMLPLSDLCFILISGPESNQGEAS